MKYFNRIQMGKAMRILIGMILISSFCFAQDGVVLKKQVVDAINDGAKYAANVLLDDEGKSKCDYNMTEGKWYPYEPAWHTGQVIYGLLEAYRVTQNEEYLTAAKRAGDWWVSMEIKDHPKLKGMLNAIHGDHAGDFIVFATVSDGTPGLFKLYETTKDKRYADIPTQAGQWMLDNMYVPEHRVFYDNIDPKSGEVLTTNSPFWPDKKNQELFDVARPNNEGSLFKDMYEYSGKEKYKKVFIELCESLIENQGPEGLWMNFTPNDKEGGTFHPRFNLWNAESLLEGYDLTKDKRYLEAAKKTVETYAKAQRTDGTIYYKNYLSGKYVRGSICGSSVSFLGMLMIRLDEYGEGNEYKDRIDLCAKWVVTNRFLPGHPDPNLAGAFMNTRRRNKQGKIWLVNRDVGTSFGLRFLSSYYSYKFSG